LFGPVGQSVVFTGNKLKHVSGLCEKKGRFLETLVHGKKRLAIGFIQKELIKDTIIKSSK